jgi:hypothetical protein
VSGIPKEFQGLLLTTPRLRREQRTIEAMLHIWCDAHVLHMQDEPGELCGGCEALFDYASYRLFKCPYGEEKPVCRNCRIHCYTKVLREKMQAVMRFAGPRMLFKHPILAIRHMRDGKRIAPRLEKKNETLGASGSLESGRDPVYARARVNPPG